MPEFCIRNPLFNAVQELSSTHAHMHAYTQPHTDRQRNFQAHAGDNSL